MFGKRVCETTQKQQDIGILTNRLPIFSLTTSPTLFYTVVIQGDPKGEVKGSSSAFFFFLNKQRKNNPHAKETDFVWQSLLPYMKLEKA